MPTIKELADACGASKPTVKRRLQELGLWEGHVNKQGATFVVDDYAASALSASLGAGGDGTGADAAQDAPASVTDALNRYIASLESQIEAKDAQISALIDQNAAMSAKLDGMGERLTDLAEQVARANAIAERPRGLFGRLLGPGREDS